MDLDITKFFEEDEDEAMHSGADVEAFAAELSRDIEGDTSTSQQLWDRNAGSSHITSQLLPQWHTSGHSGIATFRSGQDIVAVGEKDKHSSELHDSDPQKTKEDDNSSHGPSIVSSPHMTSSSQQPITTSKSNDKVPVGRLVSIIKSRLDKDRAKQLHTLHYKLKKSEIPKDVFFQLMRSLVGDQMLQMAILKLQAQAATNSQTALIQVQMQSSAQLPKDLSNSISDNDAAKSHEAEKKADSHGAQVGQMSTSNSSALIHGKNHPAFPAQGLNKQQHMQSSQRSFPICGSVWSGCPPLTTTSAAPSAAIQPQSHVSEMRQTPSHSNLSVHHSGPTSKPINVTNMSTSDRPHSLNDPKKILAGNLTHMNSNIATLQNQVQRLSSTSEEQKTTVSPSTTHLKKKPSNKQQKSLFFGSHGLSSLPPAPSKLGTAPGNLQDEFEIQSSRTGLTPATLVLSSSVSSPSPSLMETNILSRARLPSLSATVGTGNNSKAAPKKPLVGQKKPMKAPGSSPPSSKKQKVSESFADQSIEHLNDVTAVCGVNLREEEEQLFSRSKEDCLVSEESQQVVREEEKRLILQKIPLQKKMVEIMAKFGLKNMAYDVERCLSLFMEERMCRLLSNVIRLSKQRVGIEKPRHKTIVTSDVRKEIMAINCRAREEWEKKQAETEKSQKLNELESSTDIDAYEKVENRGKSTKVNKDEDNKMRAKAANFAVRAATGVDDITSRWKLMIEAKQKEGGSHTSSGPHTNRDVRQKPLATATRNTRENQELEKRDPSTRAHAAPIRKVGRNQVIVPQVARSISVKDVIAVLERETQMSKSTLLYRLYDKVSAANVTQ